MIMKLHQQSLRSLMDKNSSKNTHLFTIHHHTIYSKITLEISLDRKSISIPPNTILTQVRWIFTHSMPRPKIPIPERPCFLCTIYLNVPKRPIDLSFSVKEF